MERTCGKCGETKPAADFYLRKGKPTAWCKGCYREWHRERYTPKDGADDAPRACSVCGASYRPKARRPSKFCSAKCKAIDRKESGAERAAHLMRKFGITPDEYDAMLVRQNGGCAICGCRPDEQAARYTTFLHVDHDHVTGRVRGLLCAEHNLLLGRFNDDPALLRRAAEYLEAAAS